MSGQGLEGPAIFSLIVCGAVGVVWGVQRLRLRLRGPVLPSADMLPPSPPLSPVAPPVHMPVAPRATGVADPIEQRLHALEQRLSRLAAPTGAPLANASLRDEVGRLADEGASIPHIARALSIASGEVELLLRVRELRNDQ